MSERPKSLVIDDDDCILKLMGKMLDRMGFNSELCNTWRLGMSKFDQSEFDLIILDVHMPGKDGFQLAKEMRAERPRQKILIITGLAAGEVYRHLLTSGADFNDILYKPFSFDKIKRVVSTVMGMEL